MTERGTARHKRFFWGEESNDVLTDRPFSSLKKLLKAQKKERQDAGPFPSVSLGYRPLSLSMTSEEEDTALFLKAMEGVVPLHHNSIPPDNSRDDASARICRQLQRIEEERIAKEELEALVSGKVLIPVKDTPEFVQGTNPGISPHLCKRLHNGDFSVQAYLDLHGMDSISAIEACEEFLSESMALHRRCIAIIHGRGLSSKGEPVLKGLVLKWIRQGPYRRFVLAYASAPPWDGGAGVTYILLSKRPVKKRRKRHGISHGPKGPHQKRS